MMIYHIEPPEINNKNIPVERRFEILYEYLIRQNKDLEFLLKNIEEENLSEELKQKLERR